MTFREMMMDDVVRCTRRGQFWKSPYLCLLRWGVDATFRQDILAACEAAEARARDDARFAAELARREANALAYTAEQENLAADARAKDHLALREKYLRLVDKQRA